VFDERHKKKSPTFYIPPPQKKKKIESKRERERERERERVAAASKENEPGIVRLSLLRGGPTRKIVSLSSSFVVVSRIVSPIEIHSF
jgi:hypothetical protein